MKDLRKLSVIILGLFLAAMLVVVGCGGGGTTTEKATDKQSSEKPAAEEKEAKKAEKIEGTVYLPGMGGHIAVAKLEIDPENAESPITVANLDKIRLGAADTWATHDVRIDQEKGVAFSAAYVKPADGKIRVAKIDLATAKMVSEVQVDPSPKYVDGPMFCASGQSKDMYLPVSMGYEGWIDVFDKETLDLKHRVHFDDPKITKDYIFAHGVQTPDMSQFLLTLNATTQAAGKKPPRGKPDILFYMLDMAALEQGKIDIKKTGSVVADAANSIAFRQYFTSDGKYLLQSARDRVLVIDADTLQIVRETGLGKEVDTQIEVHDVMPIPGDKYAIMALRVPVKVEGAEETLVDGRIQLYDVENGKTVGSPVSVCRACHEEYDSLKTKKAVLCGIDAVWKK